MHRVASRLVAGSVRRVKPSSSAVIRTLQARQLHNRVLPLYDVENGMGDFLPPASLKMIAEDYQQGLLDRLNDEVKDTPQKTKTVVQTVIEAAQDPSKALMFNYASEALNNSFFLSCLKPPSTDLPNHEDDISHHLSGQIRTDFESLTQLKSIFSATALGMFGQGWVWLVCDQSGSLAVLPTFGTGTLLIRSRERLQRRVGVPDAVIGEEAGFVKSRGIPGVPPASPAAPSSPVSGASSSLPPLHPPRTRALSTPSRGNNDWRAKGFHDPTVHDNIPVGETLFPLLCLSVHEHAWISAGYGIWGKEEYLKRFWHVVNWKQVSEHYATYCPDRTHMAASLMSQGAAATGGQS